MYKARLTESGAKRVGHPELANEIVEFDRYNMDKGHTKRTVENIYHNERRIARILSYAGKDPSLEILKGEIK